jgi:hypothetical protein
MAPVDETDPRRGLAPPQDLSEALIEEMVDLLMRTPNETGRLLSPEAVEMFKFLDWCDERESLLLQRFGHGRRPIKTRKTPAGLWKQFQKSRKIVAGHELTGYWIDDVIELTDDEWDEQIRQALRKVRS